MSDLKAEGFDSSPLMEQLGAALAGLSEKDRKAEISKTKSVFEIQLKNKEGTEQSWTIDLKKEGAVTKGKAAKADVTLIMDGWSYFTRSWYSLLTVIDCAHRWYATQSSTKLVTCLLNVLHLLATFIEIASGKLGGQKAFMTGKLKTKGNMMLATKLEGVLKIAQQSKPKAKL
ncbi:hypothetical protein FRB94_003927 [Tulasnella sp. JGI-2019a]|nr:hypothetical protein FRB94_003927 [Tulasnella sp. JGI-2019a]